jgi:hypothetical protein
MFSLFKMVRSMADSNRRTSFCRALPSLSANRPFLWNANLHYFIQNQNYSINFILNPFFSLELI